eukprot:66547_1
MATMWPNWKVVESKIDNIEYCQTLPQFAEFAAVCVDHRNKAYMFGGLDRDSGNDFYAATLNNDKVIFSKINSSNIPPKRRAHAILYHDKSQKIYIFGGLAKHNERSFGDLWEYNPSTNTFKQLQSTHARTGAVMLLYNGNILIHGGSNWNGGKDIELYDCNMNSWKQLKIQNTLIQRATHCGCIYNDRYLIVVGGWNRNQNNDMLEIIDLQNKWCYNSNFSFNAWGSTMKILSSQLTIIGGFYNRRYDEMKESVKESENITFVTLIDLSFLNDNNWHKNVVNNVVDIDHYVIQRVQLNVIPPVYSYNCCVLGNKIYIFGGKRCIRFI